MRIRRLSRPPRRRKKRPLFRPWALVVPIGVLLLSLPLLRPLRHAVPADDERLRLTTVQAILDHHTFAVPNSTPDDPTQSPNLIRVGDRLYADQQPLFAAILAGPSWVLRKLGWDLAKDPEAVAYVLTVLAVTLPVAGAGDLLYRMARLFELTRPWRSLLAALTIIGSGLLSYSVVLNAQVPAACLIIASAASLVHVEASKKPRRMAGWILLAGFCAALAIGLDPVSGLLAVPMVFVLAVTRFSWRFRLGGVLLFFVGGLPVLAAHAALTRPIYGSILPPAVSRQINPQATVEPTLTPSDSTSEEDADDVIARSGWWGSFVTTCQWLTTALVGMHGLLTHFPILLLGVGGVGAVMHRHWPAPIKVLASCSLLAAIIAVTAMCWMRRDWRDAGFAVRWMVPLMPMVLFWCGAWIRRSHERASWIVAGTLFAWSVGVAVLGMTDPIPRDGFTNFTAGDEIVRLFTPGHNGQDAMVAAK